jgi:hypothetical protein
MLHLQTTFHMHSAKGSIALVIKLKTKKLFSHHSFVHSHHNNKIHTYTSHAFFQDLLTTNNSVVLVREHTIPTKQPPLVGKVSANFCE